MIQVTLSKNLLDLKLPKHEKGLMSLLHHCEECLNQEDAYVFELNEWGFSKIAGIVSRMSKTWNIERVSENKYKIVNL